ncbi:unnamed protein product [Aureobasidium mustum]|uniref:SUN domain-containing protein n=1 Tax=Aureobasidium mustum TaxID=2773714 RepID=A0A9N8JNH1_9PEZI|nr:unnamed protein product [Aureobasidium mustum]
MSATPAAPSIAGSRRPRAKTPKALPAVPTGKSHAYGAVGKVELSTQLEDPSGSAGGFAARFLADRGAAVTRDIGDAAAAAAPDTLPAPLTNTTKTTTTTRPVSTIPATSKSSIATTSVRPTQKITTPYYLRPQAHDSTDNDDSEDDYQPAGFVPTGGSLFRRAPSTGAGSFTDLDTQFSYEASMPPSTRSRRVAEMRPPPTTQEREAARPWRVSVFFETLHRRWQDFEIPWDKFSQQIRRICLALLTAFLLLFLFGPSRWLSLLERGTNACYKAGEYVISPLSYVQRSVFGSGEDKLSRRLQTLELDMQGVRNQVRGLNAEGIERLQSILPEQIMVRRNPETGELEYPPGFWQAIDAKLDQRDNANIWDQFMQANQRKLERHAQDIVQRTLKHQKIISKQDLAAAVSENHAEFQENFSAQLRALEKSEPSDCWCAAASDDKGKAQIGVIIPRAMIPTSITIEHMPSTGTLDIGAAPREFEIWVRSQAGVEAPQPYNSHLGCGEAPESGLVCIGKASYDIHAVNHVQNFDLEDVDGAIGFVDFAIIRVINNWGQDWTCIYRIRLHGEPEPADFKSSDSGEL